MLVWYFFVTYDKQTALDYNISSQMRNTNSSVSKRQIKLKIMKIKDVENNPNKTIYSNINQKKN